MPDLPVISVIVPARNAAAHLGEALASVLASTVPVREVIVVDDGSTDATVDVARAAGPVVRVVTETGRGAAAARNVGVRQASGEWLAFLDADDLWHPTKLARQLDHLDSAPAAGLCITHVQTFSGPSAPVAGPARHRAAGTPIPGYCSSALLARRADLERVGPFDESHRHSDVVRWFLRAREAGVGVEVVPELLTFIRVRPESLSRSDTAGSRDEFLDLVRERMRERRST